MTTPSHFPNSFKTSKPVRSIDRFLQSQDPCLLIHGPAGTGKSLLLEWIKCKTRNQAVVVLAPTGLAALNIEGQTIHSFMGLTHDFNPAVDLPRPSRASRSRQAISHICIDEASMLSSVYIDLLDEYLREYNRAYKQSFGGAKLIMFADYYQIPPIVEGLAFGEPHLTSVIWSAIVSAYFSGHDRKD